MRVEVATNGVLDTGNAMFRVTNGPALEFYDAGPMTRIPDTGIYVANVPVKQGINDIMVRFRSTAGTVHTEGVQIRVDEFHYTLAEGATGTFFDLDVTVANPNDALAGIRMDFLQKAARRRRSMCRSPSARSISSVSTTSCRPRRYRPWCDRWRACRWRSSAR